jgi:hypothetical protein
VVSLGASAVNVRIPPPLWPGHAFDHGAVRVDPTQPDERKRLTIDEVIAAVVREIFARYARGETMKAIVQDLNARKVPAAGISWKRVGLKRTHAIPLTSGQTNGAT